MGFAGRIRQGHVKLEEGCLAQAECNTPSLQTSTHDTSLVFSHGLDDAV